MTSSVKVFLIKVLIGIAVLFAWNPLAALIGITQPWVFIIYMAAWVVFWMSPIGYRTDDALFRAVNGG